MKALINCKQCIGAPDHRPGGPFCKVVSKVADLQVRNTELEALIREKQALIEEIGQTLCELRMAFSILKETHRVLNRSGHA